MFNVKSFISLLFYSEVLWIVLYNIVVLFGTINDDLNLVSFSFFILGLAGLEFAIGFLLIIILKTLNLKLNFNHDSRKSSEEHNLFVNKIFWL